MVARGSIIPHDHAGFAQDRGRGLGHGILDQSRHRWICRLQLLPHRVGGPDQKPHQMMARNIASQTDASGELIVAFRSRRQPRIAVVGKPCARIAGGAQHHGLVAAFDQHVGQRFVERVAPRDGEQMLLTFGACGGQQRIVVQPLGLFEHWPGHVDRVVGRQGTADPDWRARLSCQAFGQGGARRQFDGRGDLHQHVVEQSDLVVGIVGRSGNKQFGDAVDDLGALADGAMGDRVVQLVDQRGGYHAARRNLLGEMSLRKLLHDRHGRSFKTVRRICRVLKRIG